MLKYSADYILNSSGSLVKNHTLIVANDGRVLDLVDNRHEDSLFMEGILSPGFINTHCHLELSHMGSLISQGTLLHGFIAEIINKRNAAVDKVIPSLIEADTEMWNNGIQGVGDICNTDITFERKSGSKIRYHSFIELFDFNPANANLTFESGKKLFQFARETHQHSSIIPHAPYSVTPELFQVIKDFSNEFKLSWCIHNQESDGENELFENKSGSLLEFFLSAGINMDWFKKIGESSLKSIEKFVPDHSNLLFVHNTFTTTEDIKYLKTKDHFKKSWFALCPKANLYIEKRLPDISMLENANCQITIGTDSLASNNNLNIWDEIKTIHYAYDSIPVEKLLKWATLNGATYFDWNDLGAFRKNTQPGILHISHVNENTIQHESRVTRLH